MFRRLIAKVLSTELGVLGDDVRQIRQDLNALGEDYASHKVSFQRFQNRSGMRWARQGAGADSELAAALRDAIGKRPGGNGDFPEF
jgi:hypothetical protein